MRPEGKSSDGKKVGTKRNHYVLTGNERGAIDRAQIWTDVDQNPRGLELRRGLPDGAIKRTHRAECRFVSVVAAWPGIGELVFERR
jgi:hypothetical protein